MPTIHWEDGFRFFFYSNEGNEPPHVHVEKGDGSGKYWLEPVILEIAHGFTRKELSKIRHIVDANVEDFRRKWDEYFG